MDRARTRLIDEESLTRDVSGWPDAAVKDQGCVAVRHGAEGDLEIRYRPSAVKPMALLKALQLLMDEDPRQRVVLRAWRDRWQTSVSDNCAAAIEQLASSAAQAQAEHKQRFVARTRAPEAIGADAVFAPIHDAWRYARAALNEELMQAVREASCGRFLVVMPQNGAARLVLDTIGEGYSLYGNGWKSVAVGGRFEDMPDVEYARWAAQAYRQAFDTGRPVFQDVSAIVQLLRGAPLLLKYRRAILPIGGGERPSVLLGATLDQSVTRLSL